MTVNNTLEERASRYGKFADHAQIAQGIQDVIREAPNWHHLDYDMKQALTVIADKIARILNGDPFYGDNWHDIQGYAKLIEDRINMIQEPVQELYEPIIAPPLNADEWMTSDGIPISHGCPSEPQYETIVEPGYNQEFRYDNHAALLKGGPGFNGA